MTELAERKMHRKYFSALGWALLIYLLILNTWVMVFAFVDVVSIGLRQAMGEVISDEQRMAMLMSNGWGYLVSILTGLIALRIWKGKEFYRKTLWTQGKPMEVGSFLSLFCLFIGAQMAFRILTVVQEAILNTFGLTALPSIEFATMNFDTLSMFLYAAIGAPIMEEIIFRGLVLRHLQPYSKSFAIVMSAFLFGIFHGNLVQMPYTFLVGLVLGYVAIEYNILWAMVLHMINNLVLSDLVGRLLPEAAANAVLGMVIMFCTLAAAIILGVRQKDIRAYIRENSIRDRDAAHFFTAPGIVALELFVLYTVARPLIDQIIEKMGQ